MKEADMFWLCWNIGVNTLWDGSNSHKILEYLSTGAPVVSHYVSSYKNSESLYMLPEINNSGYVQLFSKIIEKVKEGEPKEMIENRLRFAIENAYQKNVEKIELLVNNG